MKNLKGKTRTILRLTLVRNSKDGICNMKDEHIKEYTKMIKIAEPDFVHVKGYMSVGFARKRLGYEKMPFYHEVGEFAEKLGKEANLNVLDNHEYSRTFVLGKDKDKMRITNQ